LLLGTDRPAVQHQHGVAVHGGVDLPDQLRWRDLADIDIVGFGGEQRMERAQIERHL